MIDTLEWHTLHPRFINAKSVVVDLGANYGRFAEIANERFGCHVYAVEPAPEAYRSLLGRPKVTALHAAVAGRTGRMSFTVDEGNNLASRLGDGGLEVDVLSLQDLMDKLGLESIDLLKVDIEGAEIEMLDSTPDSVLRRIGQISIEFHDFCGLTPAHEVERVKSRLHGLGFASVRMSRIGHQDTWFINRRRCPISSAELAVIRYWHRNWFGLKRVLGRLRRQHPS